MAEKQLLEGSCHCGAVRLTLPSAPEKATKCNCSLCRRLGGLWAYYEFGTVRIEGHPENTTEYIWGDKTLRNVRCKTCGCPTHWEPLVPEPGNKHGGNDHRDVGQRVVTTEQPDRSGVCIAALPETHQRKRGESDS